MIIQLEDPEPNERVGMTEYRIQELPTWAKKQLTSENQKTKKTIPLKAKK